MKKILFSISFVVCVIFILPYSKGMANEEAPYDIVHKNQVYEIRHYSNRLVVQVIKKKN